MRSLFSRPQRSAPFAKALIMAYQTYITEALVCGKYDSNTADRSFLLFTKEAGMLYAQAKSVREERSKQRYALQECSHVRATLIRGKSGWKVAGAESLQNFYDTADTREARAFVRNVILLLKRVVQGEAMHEEVFTDVVGACAVAEKYNQKNLEQIVTLRILHALGYIAPHETYAHLLHCEMPYHLVDALSEAEFKKCKEVIDNALIQSQL